MIVMGDAIYPANLPNGLAAYAGYIDGNWPDFATIAANHPNAYLLDLTVYLTNAGKGLDIEAGDANPSQFPTYYTERARAGVDRPVAYASISVMPSIIAAAASQNIPRSLYRLWSAHYGAGSHICGPGTCGGVQVDGTQWIDHNNLWDESLLLDTFFTNHTNPIPPPILTNLGDNMVRHDISVPTNVNGEGWVLTTIPWATYASDSMNGSWPPRDKRVWPGYSKVQNNGGMVAITVFGFIPNSMATVFVLASA